MLSSLTTNLQKYYRFDSADVGGNLLAYPPSGFSLTTFTTNIAGGYGTAGQYSQTVTGGAYGNGTYVVYSSSEREAAGRAVWSFGTGKQTTNFWQITATDKTSNDTSITLPNNSILPGLFEANSSGAFTTLANKQIIPGEWVTLQLPEAAVMKQFSFYNTNTNNVAQFAIVASKDNTTWTQLDYQTVPNTFYKTHIFSINNTTAYSYYRFVYIYSYGSYPYLYNLNYFMDNGANNGTSVLNWAGGSGVFDASLSAAPAAVIDICNNVLGQSCLTLNGGGSQYVTVRNVTPTTAGLSTAFWVREPSPVVYKWITSSAKTSGNWYGATMSYDGRVIAAVQPSSASGVNTGQIWRSLDYGVTWTATTAGLNKWYYVAISANGEVMLAVAEGDTSVSKTAIISRDFGATWSNTTFTSTSSPYCAISADGRIMYIANKFTNANLVVSKDGGITWSATSSGRCRRIECSADGKTVIIVRLNTEQSVTLTISKDYGTTWSDVTTWATGGYASISISADGYTILAAGYAGSTVISYDGGKTITTLTTPPVTNGSTTSNNFAKVSRNGKVMVVGQYLSAVYLSVDAGFTWSNGGMPAKYYAEVALSYDGSIIVIPLIEQPGGIYIGTMLVKTHAIYDFANSDLSLNVTNRGYIGNTEIVLPDNSWHHVVETYTYVSSTGAVNPYNMYIDGNCVHSSMVTYPALTTRASGYIGCSNISPTITDLSGSIDDFRIYDKTLTADQIHNLYLQSAYFYYTFDSVSTNGIMLANMGTGFPQYDAYMSHTGMVQGNEFVVGKGSVQLNANYSQFVTLPSFITGSVGYTIAAWVNVSSAENWGRICDFGNGPGVDNILLASSFGVSENSAFVDLIGGTSNGHITTLLPRNSWTHIAVVRNNSKNVIIYINGNKVSTSTYTGRYNDVLRPLNFIGKSNWPADSFYHGFIDDFRFYKIPLSDDSVMEIYKNPNLLSTSGFQKHNTDLMKLYKSPYSVQPGKVVRVAGSPNTLTEQVAQCFSAVNPTAYNMRMPFATGMCLDNLNNMYIADETNNVIRKISMSNGTLTTYGTGKSAYCGENINVTSNAFTVKRVYQLICDNCNNLIFCGDNRIRKINWTTNLITTIAGNGTAGSTGDNGLATSATVGSAIGLWCDSRNNIYISDSYKVRKIDGETGVITTVAGTGTYSYSGDGGLATSATVKLVFSIVTDSKNNLYIADLDDNRIRIVDAISGIITTVAGTGAAGYTGDGGLATAATLQNPHCIRVDNQNNIYILDATNNCIRFISSKTNKISTIYGSVNAPFSGDGGVAKYTTTNAIPPTMHLDANNNIYIMERSTGVVRKINNMQNRGNTNVDFYDTNNQTLNSYIMPTLAGKAGGALSRSGYVSGGQRAMLVSTNTINNLIINGDFNYPILTTNTNTAYPNGSTSITGWTVTIHAEGWIALVNGSSPGNLSGTVLAPYSGNQRIAINRLSNIYQTVTLGLGMYTLSWYMSGRSYGDDANTILVTVVTGGTTISSTVIQGSTISVSLWQNYTLPVNIITAGSYVIKFEGKRTDDVSTLIDGITLTQHTNTTDMSLYLEPTIQIATPVPTSIFVANSMTTPGGKTFVASASTECNGQEAYNAFNGTTLSYWQCSYNTLNGYTQNPYSNGIYRGGGSAAKTYSTTFTANTGFYSSKLQYWTYTGLIGTFGTGTAASEFDTFNNVTSVVNVASNGFVTTINSNWTDFGLTSASPQFGIVIRGYFYATSTGNWSFRIGDSGGGSDDYTGLWLGDAAYSPNASNASVIAPNYTSNAPSGIFELTAGTYYPIYMQFSQSFGGLGFGLGITPPGGSQTYDGTPYFFHSVNDSPRCSASMTTLSGEWLQIQLPYKLKLDNYSFLTSDSFQTTSPSPLDPSRWAVVGSNNGTSWNLVDYVDIQNLVGINILNTTVSNKFYSNILRSFKSSSTEYYSYYRIIVNALDIGSGIEAIAHLCQWNLNGIYEYTDSLLPINTKYNSEQLIVPVPGQYWTSNQLFYDNETYTASASTNYPVATPQCAFYNPPANNNISDAVGYGFWSNNGNVYSNGNYTGSVSTSYYPNTNSNTQTAILGEWLQIQLTFPVKLSRYALLGRGGLTKSSRNRLPRSFVMLGSTNGSTWYLIDAQNHNFSPPADYSYMSYSDKVLHYTFNPTTFSRTATVSNTTITRNGHRYVANEAASASTPYNVFDASCSGVLSTTNFKFGNGSLSLTAASSQYVQINTPFLTGLNGLTFSVWFQTTGTSSAVTRLFDFGNGEGVDNIILCANSNNGITYGYSVYINNSSNAYGTNIAGSFTSASSITFNHIVWTISPSGVSNIYINGKLNATSTGSFYPASIYRTNCYIGKSNWSFDPYFNGFIDEFRMYNRVVTTGEIQDLYNNKELNNQFPYPYSNGYYNFFRLVTNVVYNDGSTAGGINPDCVHCSMSLTGYPLK
jgi:hypothetical protein